jgi:chemotaxis protein CheD
MRASLSRLVVGIGELVVSNRPDHLIVASALGSCVAVCIWDPSSLVGGLLHFLLPDSRINPARAREQPAVFADAGIPLLLRSASERGLQKARCLVKLIGGAEVAGQGAAFDVGRRNILAARNLLWRQGVLIRGEAVGGKAVRSVSLAVSDGHVEVTAGRGPVRDV